MEQPNTPIHTLFACALKRPQAPPLGWSVHRKGLLPSSQGQTSTVWSGGCPYRWEVTLCGTKSLALIFFLFEAQLTVSY